MKNVIKYLLVTIICLNLTLNLNVNVVKAVESIDSINNNSIKLLAYEYPFDIKQKWIEFKFEDQGNNTAKLKCYVDGVRVEPMNLKPKLALYDRITFTLRNIYGYYGGNAFNRATSMQIVATFLESLTFTYDVDTIQLIRYKTQDPNFSREGDPVFKYEGTIHANHENRDFNMTFWESKLSEDWQFRVRKDGLYAEYLMQDRVDDGTYIIESAEDPNQVLSLLPGNNIGMSNYIPNNTSQQFTLEYDSWASAYKIKIGTSHRDLVQWDKNNGNNVVSSLIKPQCGEQFWYLHDTADGYYKISSARQSTKYLNVDANNTNVSVTNNRNNLKQKFKLVKVNEKKGLTDGQWVIASKLNNNKVLNVHIGGINPRNVTIWDRADVSQQKWTFEYDSSKNAYRIKDCYSNSYLSWMPSGDPKNVSSSGGYHNGAYWVLEYVGDGYYIFKNYHNQNMVLDLTGSKTANATNIIAHERRDTNNQKFKIMR